MSAGRGTDSRGLLPIQLGEDGQGLAGFFRLSGTTVCGSESGVHRPIAWVEVLCGLELGYCFLGALLG